MKRLVWRLLVLSLVVLFVTVSSAFAAAPQRIRLAGSTGGGGLGPMSVGLFKIIKNHLPEFEVGPPQVTGGSTENTRLLGRKEVNFGYTGEIGEAYHGKGAWAKEKYTNLRTVYTLPYGYQQYFTLEGSGIKSFKDMKGKRICVGPAGSGGATRAEHIVLPAHGLKAGVDYKISYQPYASGCDQLRDGNIDVMIISMTAPTPAVVEMVTFKKIFMIPMDPAVAKKIADEDTRLSISYIPKDVYGKNQTNTEPVLTLDLVVALATTIETPADTVYKITKAHWEHLAEFHAVSETAKFVQMKTAFNALPAPLHPGAEKYYREAGLWPLKK